MSFKDEEIQKLLQPIFYPQVRSEYIGLVGGGRIGAEDRFVSGFYRFSAFGEGPLKDLQADFPKF
jgi:hypothetical protein